ncbi:MULTISPECIES: roadblock/LC7 domain-containing protein [unclassified Streptomyces]|uniref:roadblock/LC7 domain-containing protein n=1 Tax=unclassified Streptomyces TaxID=2593676 RepID=UPI00363E87BE
MTNPPTPAAQNTTELPSDLSPVETVTWLLDAFVSETPGVTHALVATKDGLALLISSNVAKDWADTVAAALCGYASLAASTPGPTGTKQHARLIALEFEDHVFMGMASGVAEFANLSGAWGTVDTILGVYAETTADIAMVGYEMRKLINRWRQRMSTPIRQELTGTSPGAR